MKKIKIIIMFIIASLIFLAVPVYFIGLSSSFSKLITGTLRIRVNPALAGGEIMAVFNDDYFDDKGTGTYTYPASNVYVPYSRHLDILKYIVKKPEHHGVWSDYKEFWAFEVVMGDLANPLSAPAGFSFPLINIFISIEGMEGGRTDTLFPGANVRFDPAHPWHFFIQADGWNIDGKLYDSSGKVIGRALVDIIKKEDKLRITIPLVDHLKTLNEKNISYHYVIAGNYDPVEQGNFRAILQKQSVSSGGGNPEPGVSPLVYDYLTPHGESQYKILSSYNLSNNKSAVLKPVKVVQGEGLYNILTKEKQLTEKGINYFENNNKKEIQKSINIIKSNSSAGNADLDFELAVMYFRTGEYGNAEYILNNIIKKSGSKSNPAALAYLGAITGKKASLAKGITQKISFVNMAVEMLDKAASAADYSSPEAAHVLMCRASVYSELPSNFNKLNSAVSDLQKLTELIGDENPQPLKTDALILLGDDYLKSKSLKKALDVYHEALRSSPSEYYTKKIKDKISDAEDIYIESLINNF